MKRHFRRGLALLSALLLGLGAAALPLSPAQPLQTQAATTDVVKIACIGASTVAGAGAEDGTSWPSDLQLLLGGLCEVRNFGVNSRTVLHDGTETGDTSQKLAYTLTDQYKSSLAYGADIVLLMLGVNDSKPVNWKNGENTFQEDYEALVNAYREQGARVIIIKDPWVKSESWGINEKTVIEEIIPIYEAVAEKYELSTIDLHTPTTGKGELYADGVHPNSKGYQFMAELIAKDLKELGVVPQGSENVPARPVASIGDFYGEYDGYEVMQWKNGTTGNFNYTSGMLAAQMGIDKGTVVKNLTINVSYYWVGTGTGNNWWHFNTTDKTGQSAPAVADPENSPHDNGYGQFTAYGMTPNAWNVLSVSRDEQTLGGKGSDWYVSVGGLDASNSLYIRGFEVKATLDDGTVKSLTWGTMQSRRGADDGKTLKIACVGASTTTGNNVPSDKGTSYPSFLQAMLGNSCEVKNFGYPGCSVTKGRQWSYMDGTDTGPYQSMYQKSLDYMADVVIIDMGVNDSQSAIWGMGTFQKDYDELVSSYLNQGNHPLVLLSTGGHCTMATWDTNDARIEKNIQPAQIEVAEKYGLPTADLRALLMSDEEAYICKEDGVHYTDVGYEAMAKLYYDALLPLVDIPESEEPSNRLPDPSGSVTVGEYEGAPAIMWENGQTGNFSYGGEIAMALGVKPGTVVQNLTITVSYYWSGSNAGGDWWHFNTTDKDGLSAPSICKSAPTENPHDNGFGHLGEDYELVLNQWAELVVTREEQMLGGSELMVNVGSLDASHSLYINGLAVKATLEDGTETEAYWGIYPITVDKSALEAAVADEVTDLSGYTKETADAYTAALAAAKDVLANEDATQEEVDAAEKALTDAKAALTKPGEVNKAALKAALDEEITDLSGYTAGSTEVYTEALVAAKAVYADANATQEEVDAATKALTDAKAALVKPGETRLGDVNGDGHIDTGDARLLLQYAAELITDDDIITAAADLNGDGVIDTGDARLALQYAAEIITEFPAGK